MEVPHRIVALPSLEKLYFDLAQTDVILNHLSLGRSCCIFARQCNWWPNSWFPNDINHLANLMSVSHLRIFSEAKWDAETETHFEGYDADYLRMDLTMRGTCDEVSFLDATRFASFSIAEVDMVFPETNLNDKFMKINLTTVLRSFEAVEKLIIRGVDLIVILSILSTECAFSDQSRPYTKATCPRLSRLEVLGQPSIYSLPRGTEKDMKICLMVRSRFEPQPPIFTLLLDGVEQPHSDVSSEQEEIRDLFVAQV